MLFNFTNWTFLFGTFLNWTFFIGTINDCKPWRNKKVHNFDWIFNHFASFANHCTLSLFCGLFENRISWIIPILSFFHFSCALKQSLFYLLWILHDFLQAKGNLHKKSQSRVGSCLEVHAESTWLRFGFHMEST